MFKIGNINKTQSGLYSIKINPDIIFNSYVIYNLHFLKL